MSKARTTEEKKARAKELLLKKQKRKAEREAEQETDAEREERIMNDDSAWNTFGGF